MVKKKFRIIIEDEVYEVEVEIDEGLSDIEMLLKALETGEIKRKEESSYAFKKISHKMGKNTITSPITGRVVDVKVRKGEKIKEDDVVIVLEAMKTQIDIRAGQEGIVEDILVDVGDVVKQGDVLIRLVGGNN